MKKLIYLMTILTLSNHAFANDGQYETYAGIRIHKNENIAFKYTTNTDDNTTVRRDSFGFGAVVGNRLSDNVKVEFESSYTGASQHNFDYDVWANMFNVYLFKEYSGTVSPYIGLGIGFASIWGDISASGTNISDSTFDLSMQSMLGVNFALNDRIDFNLGVKYQYYGEIEHNEFAKTTADATELYFGAVYKFGLK